MSAFDTCRAIEKKSRAIIVPIISNDLGKLFDTDNFNAFQKIAQRKMGDVLHVTTSRRVIKIELKAEQKWTGNFFAETWSNLKKFRRGWLDELDSHYMIYHFLDRNIAYIIHVPKLKHFLFAKRSDGVFGMIGSYPQRPQSKYSQQNLTVGHLVPLQDLIDEKCCDVYWSQDGGLKKSFSSILKKESPCPTTTH